MTLWPSGTELKRGHVVFCPVYSIDVDETFLHKWSKVVLTGVYQLISAASNMLVPVRF